MNGRDHVAKQLTSLLKTGFYFFLSWHAAKSFIKNLTVESFFPTSMLSINKIDYAARRNIECL